MTDQEEISTAGFEVPKLGKAAERVPVLFVVGGPRTVIGRVFRIGPELLIGRAGEADLWLDEEAISRRHARLTQAEGAVMIADLGSRNGTWVNGVRVQTKALVAGDLIQIGAQHIMRFVYQDQLDEQAHRTLVDNAIRDALTGTYNRAYFTDQLRKEVSSAVRHRHDLSLAVLDLDRFKQINDTFGTGAGDLVLRHFARAVNTMIRSEDTFGRIGGEEFALILRQCPEDEAQAVLERIRKAVEKLDLMQGDKSVTVSVSIGIASVAPGTATSDTLLLETAAKALFQAKELGRNRIVRAS